MKIKSTYILIFLLLLSQITFGQKVKTVTVTLPNGGEVIKLGTTTNILWTSTEITNVNIYYSLDAGTSWNVVATNILASLGKYEWFLDSTIYNSSQEARIRVADASQSSIKDESNSNFTLSRIQINFPFSGELVQKGKASSINWTTSSDIGDIRLEYSLNGGASWTTIQSNINSSIINSYLWDFNVSSSTNARLRIFDESNPSYLIFESGIFSIVELDLTSPDGTEVYRVGEVHSINWISSNIPYVDIDYSVDGGIWKSITDSINGGSGNYSWTIPDELTSQALVRINHHDNSNIYDISQAAFTIENLQIVTPNGNEGLIIGDNSSVTWNSNISENINIDLSTDGGLTYSTSIATDISSVPGFYNFTVPNNPTNQGRIRITSAISGDLIDESESDFTIGSISLVEPGGGESWLAGTYNTISCTHTASIEVIGIDYSLDDGVTWSTIVSTYPVSDPLFTSYSWYIPMGNSSNSAKVRVYDGVTKLGQTTNISNPFSIASLQITSPLSGTIYKWGDNLIINWNASTNISDVRIEYSTDYGSNYTLIQNNVDATLGTYNWTIPTGLSSSGMKIRLTSESNSSFSSTNPGYFTVGNVQLLTPNGSERIVGGISYPITWTATNSVALIRLEYSIDGGANYTNIPGASVVNAANGTYNWTVPNISTNQARIRISDSQTGNLVDASDADFTIGILAITNPSSGQAYTPNTNVNINWNAQSVTEVVLEYTTDGGSNWQTIASGINAALGSYLWTIPNVYTNTARVRISDFYDSNNYNQTGNFTIANLKITSPNGGEVFQSNKTYTITYDYSPSTTRVNFELSTDNGISWNPIESNVQAIGTYNWTVSNISTATAKLRIIDDDNSSISDESDAVFIIKSIDLIYPDGNNFFLVDSTININWTSGQVNNLRIEYSWDNGAIWNLVTASTPALPQAYSWTIPNHSTPTGLVKISDADYPSYDIADTSNTTFEINQLYITNPNGGGAYVVGDNVLIQWRAHNSVGTVRLEFSVNNGSSWNTITSGVNASDLSYTWTVPNYVTNQALVRITNEANVDIYDESNTNFSIGSLTVTTPNGGEKWQVGTTNIISWQNISTVANVDLYFSKNNGTSWSQIAANIVGSLETWDWVVPDSVTGEGLIRIQSSSNSSIYDISNANFSIADVNITEPNGGGYYKVGDVLQIQWAASNINFVTIQYSLDNGSNWNTIISNYSASSNGYDWTIPQSALTNNLLIRLFDEDYPSIYDVSNAATTTHNLTLQTPINGEGWIRGTTEQISWTSGNVSQINIDYSADNGNTWNSITSNYNASNLNYNWSIPDNLIINEGIIRIYDAAHQQVRDSNAINFRTGKIDVTLPNISTIAQGGSVQQVQWVADSSVANVKIEYTVDNLNWITLENSYTASVGVYSFVLPNTSTSQARVKISDAANFSVIQDSSDFFTINNLSLTSPNSNTIWQNGNSYNITWISSNITNLGLLVSLDNGAWSVINPSISAALGSYSWTVPDSINSQNIRIKIYDADNISASDSSESFTVGDIQIQSPSLSEVWQYNRYNQIKWQASSSVEQMRLEYSSDGTNWNFLANVNSSDSIYNWRTNQVSQSTTMYIRLYDTDSDLNSSDKIIDVSNVFSIVNLNLNSPTNLTQWQAGTTETITWSSFVNGGLLTNLTILASWDNGINWQTLSNSVNYSDFSYDWNIPNTTSNQVFVKIVSNDYTYISDSTSAAFTISDVSVDSISIGDQFQANRTYPIYWTSSFINNIDLYYSLDNGASWNTIVQNLPANNSYYNWDIPAGVSTNQGIIRIYDSSNPNIVNLSSNFTIKDLNLLTPNGNERWDNDNPHAITWNSNLINLVDIDYSLNNGLTWSSVTTNQDANSFNYSWLIPDSLSSSNSLIRIVDVSNSSIRDSSQQRFNIGNFLISKPIGGEKYQIGKTYSITWDVASFVTSMSLDYSIDGGLNWVTLDSDINPNTEPNYSWTIGTGLETTQGQIRISDNNSSLQFESNIFTIVRLSLTSPIASEFINLKYNYNISWNAVNIPNLKIQFSEDRINWISINDSISAVAGNYSWAIPSTFETTTGYLRILDLNDSTIYSQNTSPFTIGEITVSAPNGGEIFQSGSSQNIIWTNSNSVSQFNISYSVNNGDSWNSIVNNTNSIGNYTWNIPIGISSDSVLIRVIAANSNNMIGDTSDAVFRINSLTLNSPSGGESYQVGKNQIISWSAGSNISNVDIEYINSNLSNWQVIAANQTASNLSYVWNVPNISNDNVKIRIKSSSDSQIFDTSSVFRVGNVQIVSPATNQKWQVGEQHVISWNKSVNVSSINLYYKTEDNFWNDISLNNSNSLNQFVWTIPDDVSSNVNLLLEDYSAPSSIFDTLDFNITISNISILKPDLSSNWQAGKQKTVTWSASTDIQKVGLEYSLNQGSSWNIITDSTLASNGAINWNIPTNATGDNVIVRVFDINSTNVADTSENFRIANVSLTTPSNFVKWQVGDIQTIKWNKSNNIAGVNLYYKTDGDTWNNISTNNQSIANEYLWTIPDDVSQTVNLRVEDYLSQSILDTLDFEFTISDLDVTSPNSSTSWIAGTTQNIRWNAPSDIRKIDLYYSIDKGQNWVSISDSLNANLGLYAWAIPNTISYDSVLIRTSEIDYTNVDDTSNYFTIVRENVTLQTPSGNKYWQVGRNYNISWTASSNISVINIYYSLDGGTNWTQLANNVPASNNSYNFVPSNSHITDLFKIKIQDAVNSFITDSSSQNNFIRDVQILTPQLGEHLQANRNTSVTWSNSVNVSNILLEFTQDGTNWITLPNTPMGSVSGNYNWLVNNLPTTNGLLRISDASSNHAIIDTSDQFSISLFELTAPNTYSEFQVGDSVLISWQNSSDISSIQLQYSADNVLWHEINSSALSSNMANYYWILTEDVCSDSIWIRGYDYAYPNVFDNALSTIGVKNISITSPTTGDSWQVASNENITWNSCNVNLVGIKYSLNHGLSWVKIKDSIDAINVNSFEWTIPNIINDSVLVKIYDVQNTSVFTISNYFEIFNPNLELIYPNGNQHFQAGKTYSITWNSSLVNYISIEYSLDNGLNWAIISEGVEAADGNYRWTVDNSLFSNNAKIKITDIENTNISDSSSNSFKISQLLLNFPTGNEYFEAGQNYNLKWTASNTITNVILQYSVNSGISWTTISGASNILASADSISWTVPTTLASKNTKVKIEAIGADSINSSSLDFITGWTNVVSPNGGEYFLKGQQLNVLWENGNSTDEVLVELVNYENGEILYSVTDSAKYSSKLIPLPNSFTGDSVIVKISDFASNYEIADSSDNVFVITSLNLTKPDENTNWNSGTEQVIEWDYGDHINSLNFEYSLDNGLVWNIIKNNVPANQDTLHWDLPEDVNSANSLVRVFESTVNNLADTSDKFQIYTSSLELMSPTGGEKINAGKQFEIEWVSKFVTNVLIEVSYNFGTDWDTLTTSAIALDSSWVWNVPSGISTDSALVRISDLSNPNLSSTSNSIFAIGWINVVQPVLSTNWLANRNHTITWTHSSSVRSLNLFYSLNNSTADDDLIPIETNINALDSSYNWSIPNISSQNALIVVKDAESNENLYDSSDRFTISLLSINSPDGGEFLQSGAEYLITWDVSNLSIPFVNLSYSLNGGNNWFNIQNSINSSDSSFLWNIPDGITSDSALIKITSSNNLNIYDSSSSYFSIGGLEVTSQNSFNKYLVNSSTNISWTLSRNIIRVDLHYKTNENVWKPIVLGYPADSLNYFWDIPDDTGDSCFIRIRDNSNPSLFDYNNHNFAIVDIRLTSLNSGGIYQLGKNIDVFWESEFISFLSFEYSTDSTNWTKVNSTPIIADSGHYQWNLPNEINLASSNYLVRLVDEDFPGIADTSAQNFTLSYLKLISPNGGTQQQIGTSYDILWSASTSTVNNLNLFVEVNETWVPIAALVEANLNSYTWDISTNASASSRVKIEDATHNEIYDISDSTFVISALEILFPNGGNGQKLQVGRKYDISWTSSYIENLILQYSSNNGALWNPISVVVADSNKYNWTIPNTPSQQTLVKITDLDYNNVFDQSNETFSIVSLRLSSPNTYTAYNIGETEQITWESSNLDSLRIQLSTDGGNTYTIEVAKVAANSTSYDWLVPNIPVANARIKISDIYDNLVYDESDTTFLMGLYPTVEPEAQNQSKTINLLYQLPNIDENIQLSNFYFRPVGGNLVDGISYLEEDYSNIVGPDRDTIKWNSLGQLSNYEGEIIFEITFNSEYGVNYYVKVDTMLVDNKAPTFNSSSLTINQIPELYGWDVAIVNWEAATDSSQPVLYDLYVSETGTFSDVPVSSNYGETAYVQNLANYSTYFFKIQLADKFGNTTSFTKSKKTKILADYDGLGNIDAIDLTTFVNLWSSGDSTKGVDLYPYTGTIPKPTVTADDITNTFDLLTFREMWIYDKYNNLIPKLNINTSEYERESIDIKGEKLSFDFNIDFDKSNLIGGSAKIDFNDNMFSLDSVSLKTVGNQNDLFVLAFIDSTKGEILFDFAKLNGNLDKNYKLHASISSNLGRTNENDSIIFSYSGISKDLLKEEKGTVYKFNYVPREFKLYQNYPNPFNPTTTIEFDIATKANVTLKIYNILGEEIFTLVDKELLPGNYSEIVQFNKFRNNIASGVYFYRIKAGKFVQTKKMVLLK